MMGIKFVRRFLNSSLSGVGLKSSSSSRTFFFSKLFGGEIVEVEGPMFAESISNGDIRWLKKKGDSVKTDEVVAEIETDKTNVEVPSPYSGTIVELLVQDGDNVLAAQKLYRMEKSEG